MSKTQSLPFVLNHPVCYDMVRVVVYDQAGIEELCNAKECQALLASRLMPTFCDGKGNFFEKLGRIETLCPWRCRFYDENGKATIRAPQNCKVSLPKYPRNPNAPRKPKPTQGREKPEVPSTQKQSALEQPRRRQGDRVLPHNDHQNFLP